MIIIYSENTIKIYTMTWNKIQVHILLIFYYNIDKHIELLKYEILQDKTTFSGIPRINQFQTTKKNSY